MNDAPVGVNDTLTVAEGGTGTVAAAGVLSNDTDPDTGASKTVTAIRVGAETGSGTSGTLGSGLVGTYGTLVMNADGSYSYVADQSAADALASGATGTDTFTYTVGDGTATDTAELTITVTGVNDVPTSTNDLVSTPEDVVCVLGTGDFGSYSDVDGNALSAIVITGLPAAGSLQHNGAGGWSAVGSGDSISAADISAGKLRFVPAANANGSGYASIGFKVSDGSAQSASAYTLTVDVTAVNDAPVNTVPSSQTVTEATDLTLTGLSIADVDAGSSNVSVVLSVAHGTLTVLDNIAGGLSSGGISSNGTSSVTLTGTMSAINATLAGTGALKYRSTSGYTGSETVTVLTSDGGNSGSGGTLTDTDTVTVTVTAAATPAPTPDPEPTPTTPTPTFTANLDPTKDTGELDNVTKDAEPVFSLNGGTYLQPGRTAQLVDASGNIIGSSAVTESDVTSGKVNVPTPLLDDGTYTYTAQILDATGKVVATAPVTVTVITDLDGVMPSVELAANGGDSNGDGVADWQQNNVAQLPMLSVEAYQQGKNAPSDSFGAVIAGSPDPSSPKGVKLQESAQLESIRILDLPSEPLPNRAVAQTPLIDFTVTSQSGSTLADLDSSRAGLQLQTVILLPANVTANAYMKYDRTSGIWTNLTNAASIDGSQDGAALIDTNGDGRVDRIVVTITDGGPGDEDGLVNGKVVDPGSLALVPPLITGPSGPEGALSSEKSLPENIQSVYGFTASEPVTWAISGGNDDGLFEIDAQGQLVFRKAPDYETPLDLNKDNDYILQIKATNAQGNSNTQDVTVHVTDVPEVVITGPSGGAGAASSEKSLPENTQPVYTFTANEAVTWAISGGNDDGLFEIDAQGQLVFRKAPDYETPLDLNKDNDYVLQIKATNAQGYWSTQNVTVHVTDVPEMVITGPSAGAGAASSEKSLPENTQPVHTFTANEAVTWAISGGNDDGLFEIDAQGQLVFRKAPDYETPLDLNKDNDYILQIKATTAKSYTRTQDVTVHVTDVPEMSFAATLDPLSDSGSRDFVTNIDKPQFTLSTTALLQTGQTVRLLRPDGSVQAAMPVDAQAVASGTLQLPAGLLDDGRHDFTAQVLDGAGQVLASAPVYVTVITDLDGVPPWVEQVANEGDFNKDGLQDWEQNNVAHLPIMSMVEYRKGIDASHNAFGAIMAGSPDASQPGAVRLDEGSRLLNVQMSALPAKPLPTGVVDVTPLFDFKVAASPGSSMADVSARAGLQTQVVIDLPYGVRADAFVKYDSVQQRWLNFTNPAAATGAQDGAALIDRNGDKLIDRVVLTYTDGAPGDEDGLVNGVVVDPGLLARFDVVPVYAAPLQTTDRWLTLLGAEATTVAQGYSTSVQIDFYATSSTGADTLPLKAWVNVLTGDHFYAPEGVPPPYACYVEQPEVQLGRVLKTGQGAFDVHLYLNAAGMTQIVGQAQAGSMDLLAQGYLDMGAMFASAPYPESSLPSLVGIVSGV